METTAGAGYAVIVTEAPVTVKAKKTDGTTVDIKVLDSTGQHTFIAMSGETLFEGGSVELGLVQGPFDPARALGNNGGAGAPVYTLGSDNTYKLAVSATTAELTRPASATDWFHVRMPMHLHGNNLQHGAGASIFAKGSIVSSMSARGFYVEDNGVRIVELDSDATGHAYMELNGARVVVDGDNSMTAQMSRALMAAHSSMGADCWEHAVANNPECIQRNVAIFDLQGNLYLKGQGMILPLSLPAAAGNQSRQVSIKVQALMNDFFDCRPYVAMPNCDVNLVFASTTLYLYAGWRNNKNATWARLSMSSPVAFNFGGGTEGSVLNCFDAEKCGPVYLFFTGAGTGNTALSALGTLPKLREVYVSAPMTDVASIRIYSTGGNAVDGSSYGAPLSKASVIYAVKNVGNPRTSTSHTVAIGVDKNLVTYDPAETDGKLIYLYHPESAPDEWAYEILDADLREAISSRGEHWNYSFVPSYF